MKIQQTPSPASDYHQMKIKKKQSQQTQPQQQDTAPADQTTETSNQPQLKGVAKLLAEGHFKGVAQLRLMINHADKLEGIELPQPTPPENNGKAYEKFLEIYNQINAPEPVLEPQETEPEITIPTDEQPVTDPTTTINTIDTPTTEQPIIDLDIEPLIPNEPQEEQPTILDIPEIIIDQTEDPTPLDVLA